jgi:tRNA uridine 5-carboxymethylaminomethyl modification enzyme
MFTSRAEFRLHLRIDNADRRLTPYGRKLGLIGDGAWAEYERKQARMAALEKLLVSRKVDAAGLETAAVGVDMSNVAGQTWAQLLKRPEVGIEQVSRALEPELRSDALLADFVSDAGGERLTAVPRNEAKAVETEIKFAGYLEQQKKAIQKLKEAEGVRIPEWLNYTTISGLSREMQEKLGRVRPQTIGQASRIPGVTPAALGLVHVSIRIQGKRMNDSDKGELVSTVPA